MRPRSRHTAPGPGSGPLSLSRDGWRAPARAAIHAQSGRPAAARRSPFAPSARNALGMRPREHARTHCGGRESTRGRRNTRSAASTSARPTIRHGLGVERMQGEQRPAIVAAGSEAPAATTTHTQRADAAAWRIVFVKVKAGGAGAREGEVDQVGRCRHRPVSNSGRSGG
jgi:hypothetical protein